MAMLEDVSQLALALPEVTEGDRHGKRAWSVGEKTFAWERSFSKADIKRFGDETPPDGPILALRVADLNDKEAALAAKHPGVFTIPHFDGYATVLVQLRAVRKTVLRELLTDSWSSRAPENTVHDHNERGPSRSHRLPATSRKTATRP